MSAFCELDTVPDIQHYLPDISWYGWFLLSFGGVAVLVLLCLYFYTLKIIMGITQSDIKTHSAFVVSVYPVVGVACYCAMIVPRAQLLAEAVTQGVFTAAMYQLFCLIIAYCGGESELIRRVKPGSLDPRVAPCCCWPCCCLPLLPVTKLNVRTLRGLVLQLPVVQGLVYMVLLVMWAEEESLYQVNYMYVQPIIAASILLSVWAMAMSVKLSSRTCTSSARLHGKFAALQSVLVLAKLQGFGARLLAWGGGLHCAGPITPTVFTNLIYNSVMLTEMVALALWARALYFVAPVDPPRPPTPHEHRVQRVFTIPPPPRPAPPPPTDQYKGGSLGHINQSFNAEETMHIYKNTHD